MINKNIKLDAWFIWPLLCSIFGIYRIVRNIEAPVLFDAMHVYLPAAQKFLAQGWNFLLTEESYRVVPLAYLWPALWQAEPTMIRLANCGLWVACIFFLWCTSRKLGGVTAGVVATALLTSHRDLLQYFSSELTEPIFLFGIFAFFFGLARIWIDGFFSKWLIIGTGLALSITLLSRPVFQLIAPAALFLCFLVFCLQRIKGSYLIEPSALVATGWSLVVGFILPAALVIKNGLVFDLWGLGTGSGVGLYLGTHPLFQGTEPAYLGFDYDAGIVGGVVAGHAAGDHLSIVSDPILRTAGIWQITHMAEPLQFFLRKAWWWLAHHPLPVDVQGSALRKVRLFELLTVLTAIVLMIFRKWRGILMINNNSILEENRSKRTLYFILLFMGFLGMFFQLIPILYNNRYSSALLDPWIIILTAFSLGYLLSPLVFVFNRRELGFRTKSNFTVIGTFAFLLIPIVGSIVLYNQARRFEGGVIDNSSEVSEIAALPDISTYGLELNDNIWTSTAVPAMIGVEFNEKALDELKGRHPFNALWAFEYTLRSPVSKRCMAEVAWQKGNGEIVLPSYRLPLIADNTVQTAYIHANGALRPHEPGRLRVVMHCPYQTQVQWHGAQLLESTHAQSVGAELKRQLALP